jgi:serine/threonine-protein kinase
MAAAYILLSCKLCNHEFRAANHLRGKTVLCPHCSAKVQVGDSIEDRSDPLIGRTVRGCRLEKRLGAGAMGAVYQAYYLKGQRAVAIKLLSSKAAKDPDQVRRFQREGELGRNLDHPNIVKVLDQGEEKGAHFMVMELVEGQSLAELIDENERLPWQQAAEVVRAIASALDHTKLNAVVHRDIKPGNILIRQDGRAMLVDLGLGKQLSAEASILTMQGACMGTPAYMPPEQIVDASAVTHAADVYALGATFYHAVTGRQPFPGKSAGEIMTKLRHEPLTPPKELVPGIPQGINDLICFMMEKQAEDRPQNPAELIEALDEALSDPTQVIRRRRRSRRLRSSRRRSSHGTYAALLLFILLVTAVVVVVLRNNLVI